MILGLDFFNDVDALLINLQELAVICIFFIVRGQDVVVVVNLAKLYGVRHRKVRPNVGLAQLVC